MSVISFFSGMRAWYRLLLVASIIWVIGVLIKVDPWTRTSFGGRGGGGSYNNWGEFLGWGITPVAAIWGLIWVIQGFRKRKDV
jgi:hypothetical protein